MIRSDVYPEISGHNKQRLSYIYSILSACYLRLRAEEPALTSHQQQGTKHTFEPYQFYKVLEQECPKTSFISELNFKNIAGLDDLNFEHFNEEIYNNVTASTVETVADMVRTLVGIYRTQEMDIISWQDVYKHYVISLLTSLECGVEARSNSITSDEWQATLREIELNYDVCSKYVRPLSEADISHILGRHCMLCVPCNLPGSLPCEYGWKDSLVMLLNFWIKVVDGFQETVTGESSRGNIVCFDTSCLSKCLNAFRRLVMEDEIPANQGWKAVSVYNKLGLMGGLTTDITCFFEAMIFSGCVYRLIAQVCYEVLSLSTGSKSNILLNLYANLIDKVLLNLSRGCDEHQNLHHFISSLSKLDGNDLDLKMIRCEVWRKLSEFSDNVQLESHIRVYALELMQSITGNINIPVKLVSVVEPWEAWDESYGTSIGANSEIPDVSNSITNTLVALKSSRLAATISPDIRINQEDLVSLDSAVSCFLHLCTFSTKENIDVLETILDEWEGLFPTGIDKENAGESHEEVENWSNDAWDEDWESLSEEQINREGKKESSVHVRSLHTCWMQVIIKLVGLSEPGSVMELLDWSLSKPGILLKENEAQSLFHLVAEIDCFMALKMLLLLPYEALWFQCLCVVEFKLRNEGFLGSVDDYELLTLMLSSGVLQIIATDPAFNKFFSYCFSLVGRLARLCQEDLLKCSNDGRSRPSQNESILFSRVLLPCFVSELVKAGHCFLASFAVSRWMHAPSSLGFVDVVDACLRRYLEGQVLQVQPSSGCDSESSLAEVDSCRSLVNTISNLRGKLASMMLSALSTLPTSTFK